MRKHEHKEARIKTQLLTDVHDENQCSLAIKD